MNARAIATHDRIAALEQAVAALVDDRDRARDERDRALAMVYLIAERVAELEARAGMAVTPDAKPPGLTIAMAAYKSGYSESGIRARIRKGKIVPRRVGGRVFIPEATLSTKKTA